MSMYDFRGTKHRYIASVIERDRDNGTVVELDRVFDSVKTFRAWCRAQYDFRIIRMDKTEYYGQDEHRCVSVKFSKIY